MLRSSIHHYETLSGPPKPCLVRSTSDPELQKRFNEKGIIKQFIRQIQFDIPLFYEVYEDDKRYFQTITEILGKRVHDFVVKMEIIPYLYEVKQEEYVFGDPYMMRLMKLQDKRMQCTYKMNNLELTINYTKYLSLDEKNKALKIVKTTHIPCGWSAANHPVLRRILERIPENERLIYYIINLIY